MIADAKNTYTTIIYPEDEHSYYKHIYYVVYNFQSELLVKFFLSKIYYFYYIYC